MDNSFALKPNMLLGVSTSATQIDGGEVGHTWKNWYEQKKIKNGTNPAMATQHWEKWREDVMLMHQMGIETYRMSIEWARVEPEEGVFDQQAIDHIKEELMLLIGMGIKPLVTLHYFTDPLWFAGKGGWALYDNVRCFLIYVERIVRSIGHLVGEYITINEPNTYAVNGYLEGLWPPGVKSLNATVNVMSNMAAAHIKAYKLIHDVRRSMGFQNTRVSFAIHMRVFEAKKSMNVLHKLNTANAETLFQGALTLAMATGEFHGMLKNYGRDRRGAYCDFHALNYYTRSVVAGVSNGFKDGSYKNDLGWDIYPEGITECCAKLEKIAPLPIYITENGTCDLNDRFRSRFIYEHLRALCTSGLPVKRYYYRCFCDGFEWLEGSYARFGIVHTDFDTMERSVKQSGAFYREMIKFRGVTQEMYDKYVADETYHY